MKNSLEDKTITGDELVQLLELYNEFEACSFKNIKGLPLDFSRLSFVDCEFIDSDLTGTKINQTAFKTVKFTNCKLMGMHFLNCTPFLLDFHFHNCILDFSIFDGLKIPKTTFLNSQLKETNFVNTELKASIFKGSNLQGTRFENSVLDLCDFRNTQNLFMNPNVNSLKKTIFDRDSAMGLLAGLPIIIKD
jgi:fluoroquinolone resistance protein